MRLTSFKRCSKNAEGFEPGKREWEPSDIATRPRNRDDEMDELSKSELAGKVEKLQGARFLHFLQPVWMGGGEVDQASYF